MNRAKIIIFRKYRHTPGSRQAFFATRHKRKRPHISVRTPSYLPERLFRLLRGLGKRRFHLLLPPLALFRRGSFALLDHCVDVTLEFLLTRGCMSSLCSLSWLRRILCITVRSLQIARRGHLRPILRNPASGFLQNEPATQIKIQNKSLPDNPTTDFSYLYPKPGSPRAAAIHSP